ncbi:long-chain-fatty-acid--CoA ligase [Planococcus salinus]|uniref:Long-chain fatty acid--CoA ligase n=1 Tax=Planococcus salinus TaxID=1848460 RepID=A0A3M8PAW8_9BACL|nr:long-chain fatty acid--CoA ligase [Planococcus salinus]RNF40334.1 long-chain fatty acid--CoA ligase [Planococcus salinus]
MRNLEKTVKKPWLQWLEGRTSSLSLPECSVYELLENANKQFPDRAAILFENKVTDYRSLKEQVDKLGGKWQEMGLEKGDRIGLMLANHPLYIVSYYAAQALGLIVVQVNPMYTFRELMKIAVDSELEYIIFDKSAKETVAKVHEVQPFSQCFTTEEEDSEWASLHSLIASGTPLKKAAEIDPYEDISVIQYTGGTSGEVKGAMLTHHNLTSNVIQSYAMYGETMKKGQEVILTATPLYHVYAMTSAMNLGIYLGATILLFPKFEIQKVLESIEKYRPTFFPGVPKMYNAFVNYPEITKYDLTCLNHCSCGSAPLPVEVLKRFEELTGGAIGEGFGLSEASPSTHRNPPFAHRKVGSIGLPLPGTDCMIVDDCNAELGPHCVGELLIKGPQIMKGYWKSDEETKKSLQNGWLYTGDLAMMDEEGYFYIVGRKKEMIIVGGFNIYPQEVESVLYEHPDIQEAAVASIPKEEFEETVKAFIVPKDGTEIDIEEIKGYCYSKLTPYKVPKEFEIIEQLPRNTVGKLLKRVLVQKEIEKHEKKEESGLRATKQY